MFGIGSGEFLVILVVALVLLGPQKLPEILKAVGKGINEFRRMTSDVKSTLEREIQKADEIKRIAETQKELFGDDADKPDETSVTAAVAASVADAAPEHAVGDSGASAPVVETSVAATEGPQAEPTAQTVAESAGTGHDAPGQTTVPVAEAHAAAKPETPVQEKSHA